MKRIVASCILFFIFPGVHSQVIERFLDQNWEFRNANTEQWHAAEVPGTVHTDLMARKLIPDPFHKTNESMVQWIENETWEYQTRFDLSPEWMLKRNLEIEFEGLDTRAEVYLNGKKILAADNMFRSWKSEIKLLAKEKGNHLLVRFLPDAIMAKKNKQSEKISYPDNERIYVRKAQYQFGWDWGPRLVTAGIWKNIRLTGWNEARMGHIGVSLSSMAKNLAVVRIEVEVFSEKNQEVIFSGSIQPWPKGDIMAPSWPVNASREKSKLHKGLNTIVWKEVLRDPQLWNPGKPNLYSCTMSMEKGMGRTALLDTSTTIHFGLRHLELVRNRDSLGESFYFSVNGHPVYIKGANWIPADNFLPRVKRNQRYRLLLDAAKEANINMLRVWGGGTYEDDQFYELCDELGIMVWQDFMFAGAMYPGDSSFVQNVTKECTDQIKRLRNHPSLVLWCGNNEIEEAWFNWGWQKQFAYSSIDSTRIWGDYQNLFHRVIPSLIDTLDPTRPYWPSSPSLGWGRDSAYKRGDVHYWGVWWGKEKVEKYRDRVGRFVSEYGMQGLPDMKTILQFADPGDLDTASAVMKAHQKHPFGWENIRKYITDRFQAPKDFDNLVYVSQLMQADAIKMAIEAHRAAKPLNMGTLFWQWNDCWPVTSWSAIDYYGRKKALYYEVKRSFQNLVILPSISGRLLKAKVACDSTMKYTNPDKIIRARVFDMQGEILETIMGHAPQDVHDRGIDNIQIEIDTSQAFRRARIDPRNSYLQFEILESGNFSHVYASCFFLLLPPNELKLPPTEVKWTLHPNQEIELSTDNFAYGVYIDGPDGMELEDNYFHLAPHEKKRVKFRSLLSNDLLKKNIRIKSLADTY